MERETAGNIKVCSNFLRASFKIFSGVHEKVRQQRLRDMR